MKITGKLHKVFETQQVTEKFSKREFILEIFNDTFANYPKFELQNKNCDKLDIVPEGSQIEIEFDLRGRAWTNKQGETQYFNTLVAWKIYSLDTAERLEESRVTRYEENGITESDDLPF